MKILLETLPIQVQSEVRETLTEFSTCYVSIVSGEYEVNTSCGISFGSDGEFISEFNAKEVFNSYAEWKNLFVLLNPEMEKRCDNYMPNGINLMR